MKKSLIAAILLILGTQATQAAIIVSSGITSTGGTLEITNNISFPITTSTGGFGILVFDEWVTSDGNQTALVDSDSGALNMLVNETSQAQEITSLNDNLATTISDVTPNDGFIQFSTLTVTEGDVVTILAGTYNFNGSPNFNPDAVGTFEGEAYLTTTGGTRISPNVSTVPEPGTYALFAGVAGLAIAALTRRKPRK